MTDYFLDTSALAKHYHQEVGTATVEQVFQHPASVCYLSRLTTVELYSVFARRVQARELENRAIGLFRQRFLADIVDGRLTVVRMTDDHYRAAFQTRHRA